MSDSLLFVNGTDHLLLVNGTDVLLLAEGTAGTGSTVAATITAAVQAVGTTTVTVTEG